MDRDQKALALRDRIRGKMVASFLRALTGRTASEVDFNLRSAWAWHEYATPGTCPLETIRVP